MKMTKSQPQSHQKLHGTQEFWGMEIGDEEAEEKFLLS